MNKRTIYEVQKALKEMGYDVGPLDGIFGPKTRNAIFQYQRKKRLVATGQLDEKTLKSLGIGKGPSHEPDTASCPWVEAMYQVKGLHEVYHKKSLWDWLKLGGKNLGDPAVYPWCGWAVQTVFAQTLPNEPLPSNPFAAISWLKFGREIKEPTYGCVLVFWRGSPSSWKGHVGFYIGETKDHFLVLGGNQKNSISETLISKKRLRNGGMRWPITYELPSTPKRVLVDSNGKVITTNEE